MSSGKARLTAAVRTLLFVRPFCWSDLRSVREIGSGLNALLCANSVHCLLFLTCSYLALVVIKYLFYGLIKIILASVDFDRAQPSLVFLSFLTGQWKRLSNLCSR